MPVMPCLRSLLGVLLVMIALASASQSWALQNFSLEADASQSDQSDDQSDGQQGDQVTMVDFVVFQKRFAVPGPPQSEKPSKVVRARSGKTALAKFSRAVTFPAPARLLISRCGLLPRAPSIA